MVLNPAIKKEVYSFPSDYVCLYDERKLRRLIYPYLYRRRYR